MFLKIAVNEHFYSCSLIIKMKLAKYGRASKSLCFINYELENFIIENQKSITKYIISSNIEILQCCRRKSLRKDLMVFNGHLIKNHGWLEALNKKDLLIIWG